MNRTDTSGLDKLIHTLPSRADKIASQVAFGVEGMAKQLAPHDTYALRQGINTEKVESATYHVQDSTGLNSKGAGYGLYQELGFTHYRSGSFIQNPFAIPALEYMIPKVTGIAKMELIK